MNAFGSSAADGDPSRDAHVRRSVVLETCLRLVFHAIAATSLYFLFAGHNSPGGGFIGGLVAGAALVLRYLVGSGADMGALRLHPTQVLGAGLLLAAGTAVAPWVVGGDVLQSGYVSLELPLLGTIPLTSVLVFDTGVYLIVVGLVLTLLTTLGTRAHASLGEIDVDASGEGAA